MSDTAKNRYAQERLSRSISLSRQTSADIPTLRGHLGTTIGGLLDLLVRERMIAEGLKPADLEPSAKERRKTG
jgi:hypothetical protein